jgi:dTDP-4-dehydrorhamnose reductase
MKNLSQGCEIKVLVDQIASPTYASNLAEMLLEIIDRKVNGIINASGSSRISRFDQALSIASLYNLDKNLLRPATIDEMEWNAPHPKGSSLNTTKACNT